MISIILSIISVNAQTTTVASPADGLPIACLFPSAGFNGAKTCFTSAQTIDLDAEINDKAFSMIVKPGCVLLGATDAGGVGTVRKFINMNSELGTFNGAISSIQINCADIDAPRNKVCVFTDADFKGVSACYNVDGDVLLPEESQDLITSAYVRDGCKLSAYMTDDLSGDALVVTGLVTKFDKAFDDRIKSFTIDCSAATEPVVTEPVIDTPVQAEDGGATGAGGPVA